MNAVPLTSPSTTRFASVLTAAAVVLGVIGCLGVNSLVEQAAFTSESPLVGNFRGLLVEGSTNQCSLSTDPVVTKISQLPNGDLAGEYTVIEAGEKYTGKLKQQGPVHDHDVNFEWTDEFGHGTLAATFDEDYCQFSGKWRNDEGTMINEPWSGERPDLQATN